jgi:nucleotide-binding universal stress UspA family protein
MTAFDPIPTGSPHTHRKAVFGRVLIGVDGTPPAFEACRQAAVLAEPDASIEAVCVVHLSDAIQVGLGTAPAMTDALREEAAQALSEAARILAGRATTRFVNGFVTQALLHEIESYRASVIAIGSHGHTRAAEILIGGVAGELLHGAPCSVLVARPPQAADAFPGPVVVGVDGSPESRAALGAAVELAVRFGASLDAVVATHGHAVDLEQVRLLAPVRVVEANPVAALVEASREAGLVVVGSRGLHGVRALGSVSERVAHQAACSVLVVREGHGG